MSERVYRQTSSWLFCGYRQLHRRGNSMRRLDRRVRDMYFQYITDITHTSWIFPIYYWHHSYVVDSIRTYLWYYLLFETTVSSHSRGLRWRTDRKIGLGFGLSEPLRFLCRYICEDSFWAYVGPNEYKILYMHKIFILVVRKLARLKPAAPPSFSALIWAEWGLRSSTALLASSLSSPNHYVRTASSKTIMRNATATPERCSVHKIF